MKIGIIGLGTVGKAIREWHLAREDRVLGYDTAEPDPHAVALREVNKEAEVIFICVPTPNREDGLLDCSAVEESLAGLSGSKVVIVKSTLMPGETDRLQAKYPQHRLFYVPEFLNEDTAVEDYAQPARYAVVGEPTRNYDLGGPFTLKESEIALLERVIPPFPDRHFEVMPARQAEFIKLATNAFYALKVTFANMLYDLGMTQDALHALADCPRVGRDHFTIIHKGYRGFAGKCLPKDTSALRALADEGLDVHNHDDTYPLARLLESVIGYNEGLLSCRRKPTTYN